jgi:hypothetical protein
MNTLNPIETKEQRKARKAAARQAKEVEAALSTIDSNTPVTILCVRFGTRYGREYVERLRNMVSRHLTVPYEFVCLTDDNHPIPGVRSIVQPNAGYARGWWHKVHMFDPTLSLRGRILYFDLDVVIHNNIDKLATIYPTQFLGIHDFNRAFHANWMNLNSSVMAWVHGSQNHIWNQFKEDPRAAQRLPGDQDWIWKTSKDRIKFWPKDWIQSYKWEVRKREELTVINGKRQFKSINHSVEINPDCCVTVFHGDPKPQDVQDKFVVDNWC